MRYFLILTTLLLVVQLAASAEFTITYSTQLTTQQQAACNYAASLWSPLLNSAVPIKVNIRMVSLTSFVIVTVPNMINNYEGTLLPNVWFPTALANSLSGTELNPGEADFDIFIDSTPYNPWYAGTDGPCPANNVDMVTEIARGIGYGLGYMSSFYVTSGVGTYGQLNPSVLGLTTSFPWSPMLGYPAIYDCFVSNTQLQNLTDTTIFTNMSAGLAAQLTGGNLRFNGSMAIEYNNGILPVLYAGAYDLAKTARLNQATYASTENVFACNTAYAGVRHHSISPILLGIFSDLGWSVNITPLMPAPGNFQANVINQNVNMFWELPSIFYTIDRYAIERNGQLLVETTGIDYTDQNLPEGEYTYRVKAHYSMGFSAFSEPVTVNVGPTDIQDNNNSQAIANGINCYPNPFNEQVHFAFNIKENSPVNMRIYNLRGQLVNQRILPMLPAGSHEVNWYGTDLKGYALPSGVYLYQIASKNGVYNGKIVMLK